MQALVFYRGGSNEKILKILSILGGSISVDIFCLLSGVGVVYSLKKNTNIEFIIKRITRVYVPYFFIALIADLFINYENFLIYLLKLSTIYFWIFTVISCVIGCKLFTSLRPFFADEL